MEEAQRDEPGGGPGTALQSAVHLETLPPPWLPGVLLHCVSFSQMADFTQVYLLAVPESKGLMPSLS